MRNIIVRFPFLHREPSVEVIVLTDWVYSSFRSHLLSTGAPLRAHEQGRHGQMCGDQDTFSGWLIIMNGSERLEVSKKDKNKYSTDTFYWEMLYHYYNQRWNITTTKDKTYKLLKPITLSNWNPSIGPYNERHIHANHTNGNGQKRLSNTNTNR